MKACLHAISQVLVASGFVLFTRRSGNDASQTTQHLCMD